VEAVRIAADLAGIDLPEELGDGLKQRAEARARRDAVWRFVGFLLRLTRDILLGNARVPVLPKGATSIAEEDVSWQSLPDQIVKEAELAVTMATEHYGFSLDTINCWPIGFCPRDTSLFWHHLDYLQKVRGVEFNDLDVNAPWTTGLFHLPTKTPWLGGRLVFGYGSQPYAAGRIIPGVRPAFVEKAKYLKSLGPGNEHQEVWAEAIQPLLIGPETFDEESNGILTPCPWRHTGDVIVAEGLPDAVSAWQAGYPVASAVTTHAAKGLQSEQLHALAEKRLRLGGRLVFIFDDDPNGAGTKGMVSTVEALHRKGLPVALGRLPRDVVA
jgi:hypothetical protein